MAPLFLTLDEVLSLHAEQIRLFGGSPGIRDLGLLQSAIGSVEATFDGALLHETIFAMAAAYLHGICRNRPFIDGNKPTAAGAAPSQALGIVKYACMKKALLVLLAMALVLAAMVYVASWFWADEDVAAAAAPPWPDGLGTLDAVPDRYPPQEENEAARKLTQLAGAVAESDAITAYVRQEIASAELTIAEPPAIADISAIHDLLLREPVVWRRDISRQHGGLLHNVQMYRSLTRTLIASALRRARQQDAAAWDDLHAAWNLTRSLDGHPPLVLRVVAMSMTRAINAVAWKMPLPVPPWFGEVQERDFVRPLLETLQYENWRTRRDQMFPLKPFAERIERERILAGELARRTRCEFDRAPETGDRSDPTGRLDIGWQRAFRYRLEREATANALRARGGQPIKERSQCSDGSWSYDGKTLRFARPVPLPELRDTSMPLALHVSAP